MIIIVSLGLLFLGIVALGVWQFRKKQNEAQSASENAENIDPKHIFETDLLTANYVLRKRCKNGKIIELTESILESIHVLFPKVQNLELSGQSAHTIRSMPSRYLMDKCIIPYVNLSEEKQVDDAQIEITLSSLQTLKEEVQSISDLADKNDLRMLEQRAEFINQKFK